MTAIRPSAYRGGGANRCHMREAYGLWRVIILLLFTAADKAANDRAEYGPHRDALSLREARSGSNAANYAAKEPAGFKGSL